MHPKAYLLLEFELATIDYYFENSCTYYSELISKVKKTDKNEPFSELDMIIGSFKYFRSSILYEMNAIVEHWLLIASSENGQFFDNKNLKRLRKSSVHIIENKYELTLKDFFGFDGVEIIRESVNALKHRGGFDFTDFSREIPEFKTIKDDVEHLKMLKVKASKFILELIKKITDIENS